MGGRKPDELSVASFFSRDTNILGPFTGDKVKRQPDPQPDHKSRGGSPQGEVTGQNCKTDRGVRGKEPGHNQADDDTETDAKKHEGCCLGSATDPHHIL